MTQDRARAGRNGAQWSFKSLFQSMSEGVCLHEVLYTDQGKAYDYRILDVNPAYEKILNINRDKALGARASELYGSGEPPFLDIYSRVAETGTFESFEAHFEPFGKYIQVNKAFTTFTGWTPEEAAGRTSLELNIWAEPVSEQRHAMVSELKEKGCIKGREFVFQDRNGKKKTGLLSAEIISVKGEKCLLSNIINVTEHKRNEASLKHYSDFQHLVAEISSEFVKLKIHEMDAGINRALAHVSDFAKADRAYVFLFQDENELVDNTHEWCSKGIEPQIDNLKNIDLGKDLPWFAEQIKKKSVIHIPDVEKLTKEAQKEKKHFREQGIKSLICVPMLISEKLIGFVGFDSVRQQRVWSQEDQTVLRLVAETFSNALARKRAESEKIRMQKQLQRAQRLETIGTLAGGIAHDFNNILTPIMGYADMALMNLPSYNPMVDYMQKIYDGAERAKELVQQILTFSRNMEKKKDHRQTDQYTKFSDSASKRPGS